MENENNEQNVNMEPEVAQTYTEQEVYAQQPVEEIPVEGVPVNEVPAEEIPAQEPVYEMTEEEYQAKLEEKRQQIISRRNKRMKIGVVLICVGFLLTIIGVSIMVSHQQKGKGYVPTTAEVYEVSTKETAEGTTYAPSLKYLVDGTPFEYVSNEYETKEYKVGDEINLRYDPENPMEVVLNVGKTSPIIFVVAFILVAIGVLLTRL